MNSSVAVIAMFCACFSRFGLAEDWPQFRGPDGQGHSSAHHVPLEWGESRNVIWRQSIPGRGWSSPVLAQGRLYLTTAVPREGGDGLSLRAVSLDPATGKIIWNVEVFKPSASQVPGIHSKNTQASSTPVVEQDRIYVPFGHLGMACLDSSGQVLWRNSDLSYPPVHGNGGSPAIVDDLLLFSCDGSRDPFVVALNKFNGAVVWKVPRKTSAQKTFSFSTPLAIVVNGRKQIISPGSGAVSAFDPRDGREIWRVRYGEGYSVVPRPVFGNGLLYIATGFDRPSVIAIRPDGGGDVTGTHVVWTLTKGAPNTPSMLLVGDELYLVSDSGIASCVDSRTGQVHWQERIGAGFSASPLYADGRIYFQDETGAATVIKPGKTFVKLAHNDLGERTLASYAVTDGALFIRTESQLLKIGESAR
ncbi:MAG TPA: PQQ-binding-like beta-propeller repeat protein [Candidatus Nitrosotalea sp.]|nr:PQQ-binding-like beta-propeller repeat protein [Candidatus Nitrosotalea sp.]